MYLFINFSKIRVVKKTPCGLKFWRELKSSVDLNALLFNHILEVKLCLLFYLLFYGNDFIIRIRQVNLFRTYFIYIKLTCVWCIVRFFLNLSFSSFFKLWLCFLLKIQNNENNQKEEREKRERKTKKSYSVAKKNLVRDHSFRTSAKIPKNSDPPSLYQQPSNIVLTLPPTLGSS